MHFVDATVALSHLNLSSGLSDQTQARVAAAVADYVAGRAHAVVVSGGLRDPGASDVQAVGMAVLAETLGVAPDAVLVEDASLETVGQVVLVAWRVLRPRGWTRVRFWTHSYHLARVENIAARVLGRHIEWEVCGCPWTAPPEEQARVARHELASSAAFERDFADLPGGDIAAFHHRLYDRHPRYRPSSRND